MNSLTKFTQQWINTKRYSFIQIRTFLNCPQKCSFRDVWLQKLQNARSLKSAIFVKMLLLFCGVSSAPLSEALFAKLQTFLLLSFPQRGIFFYWKMNRFALPYHQPAATLYNADFCKCKLLGLDIKCAQIFCRISRMSCN